MNGTFRGLIEAGGGFHAKCLGCHRTLDLDVFDMAERFGLDAIYVGRRFPLKCRECGSRDISARVVPDPRPDASLRTSRPAGQARPTRTHIAPHLDLWKSAGSDR